MSDGTIVETDNASAHWEEGTRWDGSNNISVATGTQWDHETLYRSRKGRFYIEHTSQWEGRTPSAEWVSNEEAVRWLLANEYNPSDDDFPAELKTLVAEIME
jgi:hypothetical protein